MFYFSKSWLPALLGSRLCVCFSGLSLSEQFLFCEACSQNLSRPLSPSPPWGVHVHRDTEEETTCVWPARKSPPLPSFKTISSFLKVPPPPPPRPSGFESVLFGHLCYWQSISLFFFLLVGSVCPGGAAVQVVLRPLHLPTPSTVKAMILLVTSDMAQLLPVDQTEGKWTWETWGWRSVSCAALSQFELRPLCDLGGLMSCPLLLADSMQMHQIKHVMSNCLCRDVTSTKGYRRGTSVSWLSVHPAFRLDVCTM